MTEDRRRESREARYLTNLSSVLCLLSSDPEKYSVGFIGLREQALAALSGEESPPSHFFTASLRQGCAVFPHTHTHAWL